MDEIDSVLICILTNFTLALLLLYRSISWRELRAENDSLRGSIKQDSKILREQRKYSDKQSFQIEYLRGEVESENENQMIRDIAIAKYSRALKLKEGELS